jgi:hypothetical protein
MIAQSPATSHARHVMDFDLQHAVFGDAHNIVSATFRAAEFAEAAGQVGICQLFERMPNYSDFLAARYLRQKVEFGVGGEDFLEALVGRGAVEPTGTKAQIFRELASNPEVLTAERLQAAVKKQEQLDFLVSLVRSDASRVVAASSESSSPEEKALVPQVLEVLAERLEQISLALGNQPLADSIRQSLKISSPEYSTFSARQ